MKRKIVFIILVLFSVSIKVKADNLEIDGEVFELKEDIVGEGYKYYYENNILELNGYNGSSIIKSNALNIILKGENYIKDSKNLLKAEAISISGRGTLTLSGPGFHADNISINDITIKGSTYGGLFIITSNLDVQKTSIDIKNSGIIIMGGEYLCFDNSVINIDTYYGFRHKKIGEIFFRKSDLTMKCEDECINTMGNVTFEKTKVYLSSQTMVTKYSNIKINDDSLLEVSDNDRDYYNKDSYSSYKYMRISPIQEEIVEDIDDDLSNENSTDDVIYTENDIIKNDDNELTIIDNPKTHDGIMLSVIVLIFCLIIPVLIFVKKREKHE